MKLSGNEKGFQRATSNQQPATSNEKRATSNEQRETRNETMARILVIDDDIQVLAMLLMGLVKARTRYDTYRCGTAFFVFETIGGFAHGQKTNL
ncbi:MAG: hypothetical protein BA861_06530 [Desulfobacterales bacterium S3730MH5]|nr:MAG: hypothetical protein BA861_06530 [Desulfobacterales bacterium S3730MH5]